MSCMRILEIDSNSKDKLLLNEKINYNDVIRNIYFLLYVYPLLDLLLPHESIPPIHKSSLQIFRISHNVDNWDGIQMVRQDHMHHFDKRCLHSMERRSTTPSSS